MVISQYEICQSPSPVLLIPGFLPESGRNRWRSVKSSSPSPTGTSSHHAMYIDSDDDEPIWPHDFYRVNIIDGFKACKRARKAKSNVGKTFEDIFGTKFKSTTFYDHHRLWNGATDKVCTKCYDAGCTPQGTWSNFLAKDRSSKEKTRKHKDCK
jgi:hypothetical protein